MALLDVMNAVTGEAKPKGKAEKRYVAFTATEWSEMEAKFGKTVDPIHVKKLIQGIFTGRFQVVEAKPKA